MARNGRSTGRVRPHDGVKPDSRSASIANSKVEHDGLSPLRTGDPRQSCSKERGSRHIVRSDGGEETHHDWVLICEDCEKEEKEEKKAKAIDMACNAALIFLGGLDWLFETIDLHSLLSLEARSQETVAVRSVAPKISTENDDGPTIWWPNR